MRLSVPAAVKSLSFQVRNLKLSCMNEYVASGILHPVVCLFFGVFMCAKIRLFVYSVIRDGRVPSLLPTVSWRYLGKVRKQFFSDGQELFSL